MQHHMTIQNAEGKLRIPDKQVGCFDLFTGVLSCMESRAIEDDGSPEVVLPVMNIPMKCYEAVIRYVAYAGPTRHHTMDLLLTQEEAEIVSKLESPLDLCRFIKAAQYLGNDACIAFATKVLLRKIAISMLP